MLPMLRDELSVHPGPRGTDGAPTWTLVDPLRNLFYRLSWPAFEMLSRWDLGDPGRIAEAVSRDTTLAIEAEDVIELTEFFARSQLLRTATPKDTQRLLRIKAAGKSSVFQWLLHHYLFFRIPLLRPDAILNALLPYVGWLGGKGFRFATLGALLAGLFVAGRSWDRFVATFIDHMSMDGIAAFALALGLAKIIHELGHALTAKAMGLRVPTMGLAFLVMMPVLYTDVNEAWMLPRRRDRILVGGAGILSELTLAAWATLAWGIAPEGPAKSIAFTLAATTWISSVLINASPFMRFDGYFLLMDLLDMPNMHNRVFSLARWWLRETLFALGEPVPEVFPPKKQAALIAFAVGIWIYRLTLFLGIAVLVYHFFIKIVGIFLFAVEIGFFLIKPVWDELAQWAKRKERLKQSPRARRLFGGAGALLCLALLPVSDRVGAPAVLKAPEYARIFAPAPAILADLRVKEGDAAAAGQILAQLSDPDLEHRIEQTARHIATLTYELDSVGFEESFRDKAQVLARELTAAQAEEDAALAQKAQLTLTAPADGRVGDISPEIRIGQWVGTKEALLAVRRTGNAVIDAYVREDDLPRLSVGALARFVPEGTGAAMAAHVTLSDRGSARSLSDPELGTPFGGPVPAHATKQAIVPDGAIFRVRLTVDEPGGVPVILRGEAEIDAARESPLARAGRSVAAVVLREWGM